MVYIPIYSFEFDPSKSESNLEKHGIDFVDAQAIWRDSDFIEAQAKSGDESRSLVLGMIGGKHWSAIITYRSEVIRQSIIRVWLAERLEQSKSGRSSNGSQSLTFNR